MDIEEVIAALEAEDGIRGVTATPGSQYYDRARNLQFQPCECSRRDAGYDHTDYIARTPRGACMYVGIYSRGMTISCGPKGYHYLNGTEPCI